MKTINAEVLENRSSAAIAVARSPARLGEFGSRFSIEESQTAFDLKQRLARDLANEFTGVNRQLVYQVVNEADSLAASTPFPALLLPALAEEKVRAASLWAARQQLIREQTLALAA